MKMVLDHSDENNIEPFKSLSEFFLKSATKKMSTENDNIVRSKDEFIKMLNFYKFVPKTGSLNECTPKQFFEHWTSFVSDFKKIWDEEMNTIRNDMYVNILLNLKKKKVSQKNNHK